MEFTDAELDSIGQLRSRFSDLREEQSTNEYLIRWLRARNMDLDKAEVMLRKCLDWRKENGIDNILETLKIPEAMLKMTPFAYLGIDPVSGCPVFLYLMGRDDIATKLDILGVDKMILYNAYMMEYVHKVIFPQCSKVAGRPITQFIELIDIEGFNYRLFTDSKYRDCMTTIQTKFDNLYPEVVNHFCVINAPKIFSFVFNLCKPFIAKATLEKMAIYGPNNWQEDVKKRFPMDLVPPAYGGSRPGIDEFCSGDPIWLFGLEKDFFKTLDVLKVKARDKAHLEFDVTEQGASLVWKFKSAADDISFGILHEDDEILPLKRVDAHKETQRGELTCSRVGKYKIVFDNTYSYTKGKQIHHRIEVISSFDTVNIN